MSQEQVKKVKQGYATLSYSERLEVRKFIEKYDSATDYEKRQIEESEQFKSLGPLMSSGCPCCGKS